MVYHLSRATRSRSSCRDIMERTKHFSPGYHSAARWFRRDSEPEPKQKLRSISMSNNSPSASPFCISASPSQPKLQANHTTTSASPPMTISTTATLSQPRNQPAFSMMPPRSTTGELLSVANSTSLSSYTTGAHISSSISSFDATADIEMLSSANLRVSSPVPSSETTAVSASTPPTGTVVQVEQVGDESLNDDSEDPLRTDSATSNVAAGFRCPFARCDKHWQTSNSLVSHLLHLHSNSLSNLPPQFWKALNRVYCTQCKRVFSTVRRGNWCTCLLQPNPAPQSPPLQSLLALWAQVSATSPKVMTNIPFQFRSSFARLLSDCIQQILSNPSESTMVDLLLLPHLILRRPERSGKRHSRGVMDLLSARAAQWRAGLRSELLSNSTVTQPSSRINRSLSPETDEVL